MGIRLKRECGACLPKFLRDEAKAAARLQGEGGERVPRGMYPKRSVSAQRIAIRPRSKSTPSHRSPIASPPRAPVEKRDRRNGSKCCSCFAASVMRVSTSLRIKESTIVAPA